MKLVQFWKDGVPALGLQTEGGVVDVQAEGARRGRAVPGDMGAAIAAGAEGLALLEELARDARCFTDAPGPGGHRPAPHPVHRPELPPARQRVQSPPPPCPGAV